MGPLPRAPGAARLERVMTAARTGPRIGLQPLAVLVAGLGLLWLLLALPTLTGTPNWAEDFDAYRDASMRLAEQGTLYLAQSLETGFEPQGQGLYLYPPPLGISFGPFRDLDPAAGAVVWYLLKIGALALAAALLPVRPTTRLLAFGFTALGFAAIRDLTMGNVSTLLLVPLAAGWRWLDRPAGSIALALATSVRASMGAFLLWFAVRRQWRALAWMIGAGLVTIVLTLPFVGLDGYRDYFAMLANVSDDGGLGQNRHLTSLALDLGLDASLAWLVLLATWALALITVVLSTRRDPATGYMVTAAATLLLAPLMWDHYLSMLLLPAAFLFERGRRWAIVLPLLSWLPPPLTPLAPVAALLLPFLARSAEPSMQKGLPSEPAGV